MILAGNAVSWTQKLLLPAVCLFYRPGCRSTAVGAVLRAVVWCGVVWCVYPELVLVFCENFWRWMGHTDTQLFY